MRSRYAIRSLALGVLVLAAWLVWQGGSGFRQSPDTGPDDTSGGPQSLSDVDKEARTAGVIKQRDSAHRVPREASAIAFAGRVEIAGGFVVRRKTLEFKMADDRSVSVAIDAEGRFEFSAIDPGDTFVVGVPFLSGHPEMEIDISSAQPPTHDLDLIVLGKGMSGVIIETHGIQALDVSAYRTGLWTLLRNGRNDKLIVSGKIDDPGDDEQVVFQVPPQARYRTHISMGDPLSIFTEAGHEEPMLGALEWRLHTFDLSDVTLIGPQLVELPRLALAGCEVSLRQSGNEQVSKFWLRLCTPDEQGRIKIADRFDGKNRYLAFIKTFDYKEVRLLGDGHSEAIDAGTKTLAPIERVVGLVCLDAEKAPEMSRKWALDCSPSSSGGAGYFGVGVKLVPKKRLDDVNAEFSFRTPGGRRYAFARSDLIEIEPGLFGIPIVAKVANSRLVVTSAIAAPTDIELVLRIAGSQDYASIIRRGSLSLSGEKHTWVLENLEAGRYDLNWMWKRAKGWMVKKAVAGVIILGEEEEQKISVTPPEIRILNGYFQNWALIPEADRPRRVRFGGRASDVDMEGRFETALLMPMPVSGDALIGNRLRYSAGIVEVIGIESDDSVVVALKLSELIKLHIYVDSDLPRAELSVQCWIKQRGAREVLQIPWGFAERPRLGLDGMTTIAMTRNKVVVGSIWKFVYGVGSLSVLGFFEADPMESNTVRVELEGRPVRVELPGLSTQATTKITVIWRSPSGMTVRCPVRWLAEQDTPAFWCPDTEVGIEFARNGAVQTFSGWSGDRIVLKPW